MQANYDESYIDAVEAMASAGMELRLLNARSVRQLDASVVSKSVRGMSVPTERAVKRLCLESLAVSEHHARALYSRDEGMIGAPEPAARPKTTKGRRIKG